MSSDLPAPGDLRAALEWIRGNSYGVADGVAGDVFVDLGMTEVSLVAFIDEVLREYDALEGRADG